MCLVPYWLKMHLQSKFCLERPEHDVKRLPWRFALQACMEGFQSVAGHSPFLRSAFFLHESFLERDFGTRSLGDPQSLIPVICLES